MKFVESTPNVSRCAPLREPTHLASRLPPSSSSSVLSASAFITGNVHEVHFARRPTAAAPLPAADFPGPPRRAAARRQSRSTRCLHFNATSSTAAGTTDAVTVIVYVHTVVGVYLSPSARSSRSRRRFVRQQEKRRHLRCFFSKAFLWRGGGRGELKGGSIDSNVFFFFFVLFIFR